MPNAMLIIYPYWHGDTWVFDDESVGLVKEPFVLGADEMMTEFVRELPNSREGFRLTFASSPFPGYQSVLVWKRAEYEGNWYAFADESKEGWLCPAMFHYFQEAPERIYIRADPMKAEIDKE